MKKFCIIISIILLSACQAEPLVTDPIVIDRINENEYSMVLPFVASKVRQYHGTYLGRADFLEIGSRLEDKSKEHFDANEFYLSEGQVLSNADLARLVRRESADNPYGLNPPRDSSFLIGTSNISVDDAVVVADVVEINFHKKNGDAFILEGLSLAIVLNQNLTTPTGVVRISDQVLFDYGSNMGRKLDRYIRSLSDMEGIPLYITLFVTNPSDALLPGRFIADGLFTARGGQFSQNNEEWILFPSLQATKIDATLADEFSRFKTAITQFIPESVGVIGEARYVNNQTKDRKSVG